MYRPRDTHQKKVYSVENNFMEILARQYECPTIMIAGSTVVLPAEHRFADIPSIQRYVDMIKPGLTVRARKGQARAHYFAAVREIAVPIERKDETETPWAMRAYVILHEIAHATIPHSSEAHGREFRITLVDLVSKYIGDEAGFVLSVMFAEEGL